MTAIDVAGLHIGTRITDEECAEGAAQGDCRRLRPR